MKLSHFTLFAFALIFFVAAAGAQMAAQTGPGANEIEKQSGNKPFRPTKSQIASAQEKLISGGTYRGANDGRYNNEFRASIRQYQESKGLEETGKLDEATLTNLGIPLTDKQKGIETPSKSKRVVFRVSKEQIAAAQALLKEKGLFSGESEGKYSKDLRLAIREYQSANGLKRKGSLNRATLEKMGIALSEKQKAIPVKPDDLASAGAGTRKRGPVFRATRDQITTVQGMLRSKGLYNGPDTGKLNPETRTAIKQWQGENSVKVTGTLNKVTLEAMGIELTEKQKGS